ncbi:unnamed protein product [Polarella glacialis]|uniref:Uncharacterized protein n=1 Tax=Polarella glacialis TaxID=89957 RepID=A0A813DAK4_POLGL|nr:unnamed protein product [Polarella glacialis]CAE8680670.1 unnamed protein product [Polarella glacialis]
MLLGRIATASRFAARATFAAAPRTWARPDGRRGFAAAAPSTPRPLSIRMDSLMVKCLIAAVVYFVPQDLVFLSGLFWTWHHTASSISPKISQKDAAAAVEEFKAKKGLDKVTVYQGRSTHYVSI